MKKLLFLALILALLLGASATVWGGYFFEDPIFAIGGQTVNVFIGKDTAVRVSDVTEVNFLVPRNVPARVLDPMGCTARVTPIGVQTGPLRISLAMVMVPLNDAGRSYPVQVTVFDDDGYSLTLNGRAGSWVIVPYIKWH